jgi:hypothetical protein
MRALPLVLILLLLLSATPPPFERRGLFLKQLVASLFKKRSLSPWPRAELAPTHQGPPHAALFYFICLVLLFFFFFLFSLFVCTFVAVPWGIFILFRPLAVNLLITANASTTVI